MRKLRKIIIIAAALLLLGGCSGFQLKSVESLMSPPTPFGKYSELLQAFKNSVDSSALVLVPLEDSSQGAVFDFDADLDGEVDSALIVYSLGDAENAKLRFALYYLVGEDWRLLLDEEGAGNTYAWAKSTDMPGYGSCQLLICWGNVAGDYTLGVWDYSGLLEREGTPPVLSQAGSVVGESFCLADIDADKSQELFYVRRDSVDGIARAWGNVLELAEDRASLTQLARVSMDGGVSGYGKVQIEKSTAGDRLYVNAYKGADAMITELLEYNAGQKALLDLTVDPQNLVNIATLRPAGFLAQDVDGDGSLEIPVSVDMDELDNPQLTAEHLPAISWQRWTADGAEEVIMSVVSRSLGVILRTDTEPLSFCTFMNSDSGNGLLALIDGQRQFEINPSTDGLEGKNLTNGGKSITLSVSTEGGLSGISEEMLEKNLIWLV
ncbi:MAG: hypothetical protein LBQ80_04920 [Clostridium sp.]|jgi:hypothetical protein|nr:hypothetical protein [Clostridium sp.]